MCVGELDYLYLAVLIVLQTVGNSVRRGLLLFAWLLGPNRSNTRNGHRRPGQGG